MDILDTPLDDKTMQSLLMTLISHKLQSQMQNEDPLRKAQLEHLNVQTQGLKDANDPAKLLEALSGGAAGGGAKPITPHPLDPMMGSTVFMPNGSYVSGDSGNGPNYTPPTEYNLGANPYAAEGNAITRTSKGPSDPNADVLIRSKNPATGNPWFGNQLPEWASPEARTAFNADRAGLPGTGETTPKASPGTTGKANNGAGTTSAIDPKRLVAMAIMSKTMESQGFPSEVRASILEKHFPELAQQKAQANLDKKQSEADIRKAAAPAPGGTYLDENGQQYNPIYGGDIQPKTTLYRANSPQEKVFGATGLLNGHVDATLSQLGGIAAGDRNRFAQLLKTKMSVLENNPETNTLVNFLEPATALALGSLYSAGGSRIQGGAKLAQMFKGGVYSPGDTLATTLNNLKTIETLALGTAQHSNMHPALIGEIQQRLDQIDALTKGATAAGKGGAAAGQSAIEKVSRSGKPIVSTDGGVTWRYK